MSFNSKSRVPLELYPLIIEHVDDKKDLLSMLISSRTIFDDVERKLYRTMRFDQPSNDSHILFLESLLDPKRAHLSRFVYSYYCDTGRLTNAVLPNLIKRALVTFTNLKQLQFRIFEEGSFSSVLPLYNPPFQLDFFRWVVFLRDNNDHDPGILDFLSNQHSLKTLYLYDSGFKHPQISLQNLQNLNDVVGTVSTIFPLLPRPVPIKRAHWNINFQQDLDQFPLSPFLRVLSFAAPGVRPPLSVIAERFGSVEVLALRSLEVRWSYHRVNRQC